MILSFRDLPDSGSLKDIYNHFHSDCSYVCQMQIYVLKWQTAFWWNYFPVYKRELFWESFSLIIHREGDENSWHSITLVIHLILNLYILFSFWKCFLNGLSVKKIKLTQPEDSLDYVLSKQLLKRDKNRNCLLIGSVSVFHLERHDIKTHIQFIEYCIHRTIYDQHLNSSKADILRTVYINVLKLKNNN